MQESLPKKIYFVGAGGIGMANLLRYAIQSGCDTAGYDLTESELTNALESEGAKITYTDSVDTIPQDFRDPDSTLVVYTPAVPESNAILSYFRNGGFNVVKRSRLLGIITADTKGLCVAGSHGKTTTCSMIANILRDSPLGCNAFLGGILRNTGSNLVLTPGSQFSVAEADEYDRSFLQLSPYIAVITSCDPDHLDIYGDEEHYREAFSIFTSLIKPGGYLLLREGVNVKPAEGDYTIYSYSTESGDFHAEKIRFDSGHIFFDFVGPDVRLENMELCNPVEINVENAVAASAAAWLAGVDEADIRKGISTFLGARRRFEIRLNDPAHPVLIDDYAHSPNEIRSSIRSIRKAFPGRKVTVIFQPHLYSRTRDFAPDFADALSEADETIMTEIYPARELPIPGVSSALISDALTNEHTLLQRADLLKYIKNRKFDILMTLGAADLDRLLPDIESILKDKTL